MWCSNAGASSSVFPSLPDAVDWIKEKTNNYHKNLNQSKKKYNKNHFIKLNNYHNISFIKMSK
jgi:hypothetical protein